jgi:hypothetical protein
MVSEHIVIMRTFFKKVRHLPAIQQKRLKDVCINGRIKSLPQMLAESTISADDTKLAYSWTT